MRHSFASYPCDATAYAIWPIRALGVVAQLLWILMLLSYGWLRTALKG